MTWEFKLKREGFFENLLRFDVRNGNVIKYKLMKNPACWKLHFSTE